MIHDYLMEAGVSYRHLKDDEKQDYGETLRRYRAFHHPTQKSFDKQIAMTTNNRGEFLELLNHWNCAPGSGWSYHSLES